MNVSKDLLRALRADMDAALATIAAKHGLDGLTAGNCSYTPGGAFTFKVEGRVAGAKSKEAQRYEDMRQFRDDLPPLGFVMKMAGRDFVVTGCNTTGTKVTATCAGKGYLLSTESAVKHYTLAKMRGEVAK